MLPGSEHGAHRSVWMHGSSAWTGHNEHEDLAIPKMVDADGTLHSIVSESVHSVDVPLQNPNFQDHEMFSWLHFPMEDAVEKGLSSDLFRDMPGSNVQIVKHSFNQLGLQQEASRCNALEALLSDLLPLNPGFSSHSISVEPLESSSSCPNEVRNMVAGADAAMMADGGQVFGVNISSNIPEAFSTTCSVKQPRLSVDTTPQASSSAAKLKNLDMAPLFGGNMSTDVVHRDTLSSTQGSLLPPILKPPGVTLDTPRPPVQRNFAHFSSTVAETRANLHVVSAGSGPTSVERARHSYGHFRTDDCSVGKNNLIAMLQDTRQMPLPPPAPRMAPPPLPLPMPMPPPPPPPPPPRSSSSGQAGETSRGKSGADDNAGSSHLSNSAITTSDMAMERLHIGDQTPTSPSRGSASSSDKSGKVVARAIKRGFGGADDLDYQSEDLEETTPNSKKPIKRSRAAEMHNLCERKRRDRINEKLMALRELMPTSCKTAKASILDEAINYVKVLQSQLQLWSLRTGICIPPALIPSVGLQPLQMPALPHMGMGMGTGMGVGIGMGVMDVNAVAVTPGGTIVRLPHFAAQPSTLPSAAMSGFQPCLPSMGISDGQDRLERPCMINPYSIYRPQHQAQLAPLNLGMYKQLELYNAYMQGQQQQWQQLQQQHHWQQLQQQHQQLQGNNGSKPA